MNATLLAAIIGAAATLITVWITLVVSGRRDRLKAEQDKDLLYGTNKREIYSELNRLIAKRVEDVVIASVARDTLPSKDDAFWEQRIKDSERIRVLVSDIEVLGAVDVHRLAQALSMTLVRANGAINILYRPIDEIIVSEKDISEFGHVLMDLQRYLIKLMQLDLRGELDTKAARHLISEVENKYDLDALANPPPPFPPPWQSGPGRVYPRWGVR